MFFFIKIFFYFSLSFVILSVPIKNRALFFHLSKITSPYTQTIVHQVTHLGNNSFKVGKQYFSHFFTNAGPKNFQKMGEKIEDDLPNYLE